MKKCPFCAEEIQNEAVICRFCKFDLTTGKPIEQQTPEAQKNKSTVADGVRLGFGMFITLPLIIIGIFILLGIIGVVVGIISSSDIFSSYIVLFPLMIIAIVFLFIRTFGIFRSRK